MRTESQIAMGANGVPEIENEEEVIQREQEYKEHPLYSTLVQFDLELKDFISEKQEKQQKANLYNQQKQMALNIVN